MANRYAAFIFLFLSFGAFGQIEWVGNHNFTEGATDMVRTSQGQYILVHGQGSGITVLDESGTVVFEKLLDVYQTDNYERISELVELEDSSIVFTTIATDCDVIVGQFRKFDKNWTELIPSDYTYDAIGPAARLSDNSIVFGDYGSYTITRFNSVGDELWQVYLPMGRSTDIVAVANDTILVATEAGLFTLTADGTVVGTMPNLQFDRLEILPDGNYLAQSNDGLYKYAPNFTQLASFQVQGDAIVDVATRPGEIAVLTSAPNILLLDPGLNLLGSTNLTGHNQTFACLSFSDGGYLVAGGEQFGNGATGNESAFIKEFAANGTTASTGQDAALSDLNFVGQIVVEHNWWYIGKLPTITFTVQNEGTAAIDRLNLNLQAPGVLLGECYPLQTFSKPFENLGLQPGASTTLTWEGIEVYFETDLTGETLEFCFWTSLPNHHLETNNDNDVACAELLVAGHEPYPLHFTATFLPGSDELHFDLAPATSGEPLALSLFNAAGQLAAHEAEFPVHRYDMGHLPDGLYTVRLAFGKRVGWGKVVKY